MKQRIINDNERRKAFLGALIGGIVGLGSSIASGIAGNSSQKKAWRQQQREQTRQEGFQQANAMSQQLQNQEYADEYRKKITLKNGGKMSTNYNDRIRQNKRFACGGRKKAAFGYGDALSTGSAIGGLVSSFGSSDNTVYKGATQNYGQKQDLQTPDYINSSSTGGLIGQTTPNPSTGTPTIYTDRNRQEEQLACGGRRKKCSGGRMIKKNGGTVKEKVDKARSNDPVAHAQASAQKKRWQTPSVTRRANNLANLNKAYKKEADRQRIPRQYRNQ